MTTVLKFSEVRTCFLLTWLLVESGALASDDCAVADVPEQEMSHEFRTGIKLHGWDKSRKCISINIRT